MTHDIERIRELERCVRLGSKYYSDRKKRDGFYLGAESCSNVEISSFIFLSFSG